MVPLRRSSVSRPKKRRPDHRLSTKCRLMKPLLPSISRTSRLSWATTRMASCTGRLENGLLRHSSPCCILVCTQTNQRQANKVELTDTGSQVLLYFTGATLSYIALDIGGAEAIGWLPTANTLAIASVAPFVGYLQEFVHHCETTLSPDHR